MVIHVDQISTPPTPADPPSVFEERAAQVWSDLARNVPQLNQQADEIEVIGQAADAAMRSAQADSDAALGHRNEAGAARNAAQSYAADAGQSASQSAEFKQGAETAKTQSEEARDEAHAHAAAMGQAVAMADTYTTVPATYKSWMIVVTQPHLRVMTWSFALNKYERAPWHQPCQLFYSYDNPVTIPNAIPVRADVVWQQSQFPDVVARLGLSGAGTFTLVEARGEFLRVLDNGRGIDAGRVLHSSQGHAIQNHAHGVGVWAKENLTGAAQPQIQGYGSEGPYGPVYTTSQTGNAALETRPVNIPFPLWMTI